MVFLRRLNKSMLMIMLIISNIIKTLLFALVRDFLTAYEILTKRFRQSVCERIVIRGANKTIRERWA
ncbi:hypothetical protein AWY96_21100 [Serratia plymuthica]|nr:hypothetical protein sch_12990 [Serratia plymuthica]KYQ95858.1 hypothetical protein AWY96_21100 [Serratia plymuthica]